MKNSEVLSTLFVGIDVSSRSNVVCALDFSSNKLLTFSVSNNQPGALDMAQKFYDFLTINRQFKTVIVE